jgi:hypothetical protein
MKKIFLQIVFIALTVAPIKGYSQTQPSSTYDYFKSFLKFKETEDLLQSPKITRDDKNGYINVVTENGASSSSYTFVCWVKEDKSKLFGYSENIEGMEGNDYKISFWTYDSGKWKEKKDVVPNLTLKDFLDEKEGLPSEAYNHIQYSYVLPRTGTTIKVFAMPYSELSMGEHIGTDKPVEFNYQKYTALIDGKKYTSMELLWNKKSGTFKKGIKRISK